MRRTALFLALLGKQQLWCGGHFTETKKAHLLYGILQVGGVLMALLIWRILSVLMYIPGGIPFIIQVISALSFSLIGSGKISQPFQLIVF